MKLPNKTPTDLTGMHSALRRAAEEARRLKRIDNASAAFRVALKPVLDLAAQLPQHQDLMRIARGPIADAPAVPSHVAGSCRGALTQARAVMGEHDAHFGTLPVHCDGSTISAEWIATASKTFSISESSIMQAMKSMQSPWLDMRNRAASFRAFAALQGLANVVITLPAFDDHASGVLRRSLGDWREAVVFPQDIVDDIAARSDFYRGRGFDPALTDFPRPAFREALTTVGLEEEPVAEDDFHCPPTSEWAVDAEVRFRATSEAHGSLTRLEIRVRKFIDRCMTAEFGPDWPRRRLPQGMHGSWSEKKKRAETGASGAWPLIAYADFTDYERVICRRDNWSRVFRRFFVRPESVRESFQRLYPVRLAVMYARPITQDDELLLRAEVVRLTNAMVVAVPRT